MLFPLEADPLQYVVVMVPAGVAVAVLTLLGYVVRKRRRNP